LSTKKKENEEKLKEILFQYLLRNISLIFSSNNIEVLSISAVIVLFLACELMVFRGFVSVVDSISSIVETIRSG